MAEAHLVGIFPRSEELVAATRAFARGRQDVAELDRLFEDEARKIVELQVDAGLDYVTDGQLRWQDLLRPLSEGTDGVRVGAVTRWFDNNTFFRRPVVERRLRPSGEAVLRQTVRSPLNGRPWKAVLPSPWAFAALSEDHVYSDRDALLEDVTDVLRAEVESLTRAGCRYVQFSDPVIVSQAADGVLPKARRALAKVVEGVQVRTALHTFFGDVAPVLPALLDFPVNEIGFDLFATNIGRIAGRAQEKRILIGAIDGRNSLLEGAAETTETVLRVADQLRADTVAVVPSCDLEFLPWDVAIQKVGRLGEVRRFLGGYP